MIKIKLDGEILKVPEVGESGFGPNITRILEVLLVKAGGKKMGDTWGFKPRANLKDLLIEDEE